MAEKRKPIAVVLLKKQSKKYPGKWKTYKTELFSAALWGFPGGKYRLRVNGRWHDREDGTMHLVNWTQFCQLFRRSVSGKLTP